MRMMKRYILLCFSLVLLLSPVFSQEVQDSISKAKAEADALDATMRKRSEGDTAYQVKFDATRYSMQKRYRPEGAKFVNKKFLDNTFVSFWGGYNQIFPRAGIELSNGSEIGVSVSKFLNPKNGFRLSGTWSTATRKSDRESWSGYGIMADHIFNLSSLFGGYNPYRMFEISTVEGIGFHTASIAGQSKTAGDLHLGLQFKFNTGTRLDLFVEPRFTFYTDGIDLSGEHNWRGYDVGFSGVFGLRYRLGTYFKRGSKEAGEESFLDNTFFSTGVGWQFQNSDIVRKQGMFSSAGNIINVSAGKWLLKPFGVRLSAFSSYNSWNRYNEGQMDYLTLYAGGRVEAMLNPLAFFQKDIQSARWGIIPMFGVELGVMKKQDAKETISRNYTSWTGGIQFKYYASENLAFFVEPRVSSVPYSLTQPTISGKIKEYSFVDNLFNVSIGVELRRASSARWKQLADYRDEFTPYYYASLGIGMAMPKQIKRSTSRKIGYMIGAVAGRQYTPYSGLRVGLDYSNESTDTNQGMNSYSFASLSFDYMFDLSNRIMGYDPERKIGLEWLIGPVISQRLNPGKICFGGETGLHAYWKLQDRFNIYLEPKVRVFAQPYMPGKVDDGTPIQFSLTLGTSFRF